MGEAIAGLVGALIGALAAIGAQWVAVQHQRKTDRRRELVELVSKFWDSTDRMWRAAHGLEYAVISIQNVDREKYPEAARIYEERRIDSMRQQHEGELASSLALAQMRLLYPQITDEAQALFDASTIFEHGRARELRETRATALDSFERAARKLLD